MWNFNQVRQFAGKSWPQLRCDSIQHVSRNYGKRRCLNAGAAVLESDGEWKPLAYAFRTLRTAENIGRKESSGDMLGM